MAANVHRLARTDTAPLAGGTTFVRRDSTPRRWSNPNGGIGEADVDRVTGTTFLPDSPMLSWTADALLEFQAIGRRIVNREPDDAIREGFDVKGKYTPEQLSSLNREIARLEVLARAADARRWAKAFGGGAVILNADDGRPPWEPLNFPSLRRLRSLITIDRHDLFPEQWNINPLSPGFGQVVTYQATIVGGGGGMYAGRVHASRVVRMEGHRLSHRRMISRNGWGGSELDLVWEELSNYGIANRYTANAISIMTQGVLTLPSVSTALAAGDLDQVVDRLEALRLGMGMLGDLCLDEKEKYEIKERSFSGLAPTVEKLHDALVAATDMPKTVLLGEQPGGLNASADSEIRAWYDHVGVKQKHEFTPAILRVIEVMARAAEGPTSGYWDSNTALEWLPLWQQSDEEKARTRLTNAQARALDVSSGIVSADEARGDPEIVEAYPGIDPNAPAPPPPEPQQPLTAAGQSEDDDEGDEVIVAADPSELRPGEPMISAKEAARIVGWATSKPIVAMAVAGDVPAWRVRGRWRYQASSVREAIAKRSNLKGDRAPLPLA